MTTNRTLSPDALLTFNQQLRGIVQAGIPLDEGLQNIARCLSKGRLRQEMEDVVTRVRQGATLSDALAQSNGSFPPSYINVLVAGEKNGSLTVLLDQMVRHYRRQCAFRSAFLTIVTYPIGVLCFASLILLGIFIFIMPKFIDIFLQMGAQLPFLTQQLMDISDLLIHHPIHFIIIVALVVGLLAHWWRKGDITTRDWHFLSNLPVLSRLYQNIISSSFLAIMGMLTQGGVPLLEALRICQATLIGRGARANIAVACERLERGEKASDVLGDLSFVPNVTATMLRLGADRNDLGRLMLESAEYYESEIEYLQTRAVGLLEPALVVILGMMVGTCIVALYLPLFALPNQIK
jgi:type II secretory pathway component PulF